MNKAVVYNIVTLFVIHNLSQLMPKLATLTLGDYEHLNSN